MYKPKSLKEMSVTLHEELYAAHFKCVNVLNWMSCTESSFSLHVDYYILLHWYDHSVYP